VFLQRTLHHRMELALALVLALDMDPIETRMQQEFKYQFFPFESPFYDCVTVDSVSVYPVPRAELVSSAGADTDTGIDS